MMKHRFTRSILFALTLCLPIVFRLLGAYQSNGLQPNNLELLDVP